MIKLNGEMTKIGGNFNAYGMVILKFISIK